MVDDSGVSPSQNSQNNKKIKVTDSSTEGTVFFPARMNTWDGCVGVLVVLQVISLPWILSFDPVLGRNFNYVEFIVDLIFCVDMSLQFNVAYILSADYD